MGNTPISFSLQTQRESYVAGEAVTGLVYLNVEEAALPADSLYLQLQGRERTEVHYGSAERARTDRLSHVFVQLEYRLHAFVGQEISVGRHKFPFSVRLPPNSPSSMKCNHGQNRCCVEYLVTATLTKPSGIVYSSDMQAKQTVTVHAMLPFDELKEDSSFHMPLEEFPVRTCCRDRGAIWLHVRREKTVLKPLDEIKVEFHCQNQSTATIRNVCIQLVESVSWHGRQSHGDTLRTILDHKIVDAENLPELQRLSHNPSLVSGTLDEQLPLRSDPKNWRKAILCLPARAHDSYKGRAIRVRHFLTVQVLTKAPCTTNPETSTHLRVFHSIPDFPRPSASSVHHLSTVQESRSQSASSMSSENCDVDQPSEFPSAQRIDQRADTWGVSATPVDHLGGIPLAKAQILSPGEGQTIDLGEIPQTDVHILEPSKLTGSIC